MRVIYGLLFYYLLAVVAACVLLVLLVPKFSRRIFFKLWNKVYLGFAIKFLFFGVMLLNLIVLADSINTYYQYRDILSTQKIDALAEGKVDYLNLYKQSREFYMAERNFMLTASTLFATFVLYRFLVTFQKLSGIEREITEFESAAK